MHRLLRPLLLSPFTVTVTGLDVVSSVVPDTVSLAWLVTSPSAGAVTESVGGTVSTVNDTVFTAAAFPSWSDTSTLIVCFPLVRAFVGV